MRWFFLLVPVFLSAHIVEVERIEEVNAYLEGGTLLLFDVDHTLIRPAQMMGSGKWREWLIGEYERQGMSRCEAEKRAFWMSQCVKSVSRYHPVESDTVEVVRRLQEEDITLMAFTHRPPDLFEATVRQLGVAGVEPDRTAPSRACFCLDVKGKRALYRDGILLVPYGLTKGEVLVAFLRRLGYSPRRIVLVDDQMKNIDSLAKAACCLGIDYVGLHYTRGKEIRDHFDPEVVRVQTETFGKFLSDDQARKLIPKL